MEERVRNVRSYKKTPVIAVPEIPQYFQLLLPSESTSTSSPPSTLVNLQESPSTTSLSPLGSPFDLLMDGSSSQPRLRQSQQSDKQKLNLINSTERSDSQLFPSTLCRVNALGRRSTRKRRHSVLTVRKPRKR